MENTLNPTNNAAAICCVDYCQSKFHNGKEEILNNYRCGQKSFSSTAFWSIERQKKVFNVYSESFTVGSIAHT